MNIARNTIKYYREDGTIMGIIPLKGGTYHKDRCKMAEKAGIKNWNHYTMYDVGEGMKREDNNPTQWYDIDLTTGKILRKAN